MLYGCETWTISEAMKKQLEAAEMWFLRRMMMKRQCSFLGHIVRKGGIEYKVVTGKVQGKRDRGRQRQTFLGWLGKCLDRRGVDIIHLPENRTLYHAVTSNISI